MAERFAVQGLTAASRKRYVSVQAEHAMAIQPESAFSVANSTLVAQLASQGIILFDKKEKEDLIGAVRFLHSFDAKIAEHVGWNDRAYVLRDARAVTFGGIEAWPVTFTKDVNQCSTAGSLKQWKRTVAKPLTDHPMGTLVVTLPFMAIVLRFMPNVPRAIFELEGRSSTGKSTLQLVAASASGPVARGASSSNIVPLEMMVRAPEVVLERYRDQLIIIDHAAPVFATVTKNAAATVYKAVAYEPPGMHLRYVGLLSVNRSVRSLVPGTKTDGDRLITLRIPDNATHGVFSGKGEPEGSAGLAEQLVAAAMAAHGHATVHFATKVVSGDAVALTRRLDDWQADFLIRADAGGYDGVRHSTARVFAGAYAAGMEAQRRGSLPKALSLLESVLECYRMWLDDHAPPPPVIDRLRAHIASGQILTINPRANHAAQIHAAEAALGTYHVLAAHAEVRIRASKMLLALTDWDRVEKSEEVRSLLKRDGANKCPWGLLAPGMNRERLYQFKLPLPKEESLFADFVGPEVGSEAAIVDGWENCNKDD